MSPIRSGELDASRLTSFNKLQRELAYMERKANIQSRIAEKNKWKKISKQIKHK